MHLSYYLRPRLYQKLQCVKRAKFSYNTITEQECIPVGCVRPLIDRILESASRGAGEGGLHGLGGAGSGGVSLPEGSACSGGGLPGLGESPAWGGFLPAWRGSSLLGGSPCLGGFSLPGDPPLNRVTDTCKNITLATTSLRPVTILFQAIYNCFLKLLRFSRIKINFNFSF